MDKKYLMQDPAENKLEVPCGGSKDLLGVADYLISIFFFFYYKQLQSFNKKNSVQLVDININYFTTK